MKKYIDINFENGTFIYEGEIFITNTKSVYFYNLFGDKLRLNIRNLTVYKNGKYFGKAKNYIINF